MNRLMNYLFLILCPVHAHIAGSSLHCQIRHGIDNLINCDHRWNLLRRFSVLIDSTRKAINKPITMPPSSHLSLMDKDRKKTRMKGRAGGMKRGRIGEKYWDSEVAATGPPHGEIYCQIFSTRIRTKKPLATNERTEKGEKKEGNWKKQLRV